jgi:hypothetical protein
MRRLIAVLSFLALAPLAVAQDNNPKVIDSRLCVGPNCTTQNSLNTLVTVSPQAGLFVTQVRAAASSAYPFVSFQQRTTSNGSNVAGYAFNIDSAGAFNLKNTVAATTPFSISSAGVPTFTSLPIFSSLTASRLVITDSSKALASNGSITTNAVPKSVSSGASLAASALSDDASNVYTTEPITALAASGTDTAGTAVTIAGGVGTGAGASGALVGKVAPPAATGSTPNALATAFSFGGSSYAIGGYSQVSGGAAAAASTVKGVSAAGTNQVGGSISVIPGAGTGTGAGTKTALQRNLVTTTGSAAQAQQDGIIVCESKTMSNTTATGVIMAQVATSSNTGGSLTIFYGTTASDGTNIDSDSSSMNVAWKNHAGTAAASVGTLSSIAQSSDSGSVASTATAAVSTSFVNLTLSPAYTTIVPTSVTSYMTIINHGPATITCQ